MRKGRFVKYSLILLVSAISLFPFYCMIMMSTQTTEEIFKGMTLLPGTHFTRNINTVIGKSFFTAYRNSLLVSLFSSVLCTLFSAMAGYALTVYHFKLRNAIYNFVLITMMVPASIGMIGYMNEMRVLRLSRSIIPLVLVWLANGFGVFWMTQYIRGSLQISIVESARIDGSGEMHTFFTIILPCIRPALGTLILMIFLWSWNNYLLPLVLVNQTANYTIPLYIQTLGNEYVSDYAARITGLLLSVFPLLLAFALGSRSFIRGLTSGAVKG